MANTGPNVCTVDWIVSPNSTVNCCNHRKWFKDDEFIPFSSEGSDMLGNKRRVEGVRVVELPVDKYPSAVMTGPPAQGTLRLTNVIYMPASRVNVIGAPFFKETNTHPITVKAFQGTKGNIVDKLGYHLAYFIPTHPMLAVQLSAPPVGPVVGPSQFTGPDDIHYSIHVFWENSERVRFYKHRAKLLDEEYIEPTPKAIPDYTAQEKTWLKNQFGHELKFLEQHGLSCFRNADRDKGILIARHLMQMDGYLSKQPPRTPSNDDALQRILESEDEAEEDEDNMSNPRE